jgi:hypothetical protein
MKSDIDSVRRTKRVGLSQRGEARCQARIEAMDGGVALAICLLW